MLQQTQVATVIPYFQRFMQSFPDAKTLATADEQDVLRHWEGLGYYRRARQLHAAARVVASQHDGEFPEDFDSVVALPGIGRYTAGAILSISRDQRLPVVEANTQRVYARLVGLRSDISKSASLKLLWQVAEALLPQKRVGVFNQAAMELGSLICNPRTPMCTECPVASQCYAMENSLQDEIPGKLKRPDYQDRSEVAVVICKGDRVLVRQCQPGERFAGLWDFPRCEVKSGSSPEQGIRQHVEQMLKQPFDSAEPLMKIKHGVTKYRITLSVLIAKASPPIRAQTDHIAWCDVQQLNSLPLSTTGRKIAKKLAATN